MQRKCGTCKFFEEGGIASSGWCRHPERQDLEHMVLVRKTELACRHGWDHDLWEPREEGATAQKPDAQRPSRPISTQSGSADPTNVRGSIPAADSGVDSVVEHSGPVSKPDHHGSESSPPARPGDQEPAMPTDQALNAWSSSFGVSSGDQAVDELQDESVVSRFGTRAGDWQRELHPPREQQTRSTESDPRPATFENGTHSRNGRVESGTLEYQNGSTPHDAEPVQQSGMTEQFDVESPEPSGEPESGVADIDQNAADSISVEVAEHQTTGIAELPMLQASNACCRNCRDFLPAKDGWSGWCSNPFAFEKRQEVAGDRVACQSSFGSWWSPSDDWWMERADIAHHSAPTPLVDNLIRQIRTRYLTDEGSTEGQERS